MAREVILRDDLDGTLDQVETVTLTYDGRTVEVDLSAANRAELAELLACYYDAGRTARRPASSGARRARTTKRDAADRAAVRAWAAAEGIELPGRGPIPADVVTRYHDAQREGGDS